MNPYVYERRVHWGETDAATIAYTGDLFNFGMEAIESWIRDIAGTDWYELNMDRHTGTPFVHVSMDFVAAVTPRDPLALEVRVEAMGTSSIKFRITAYQKRREVAFRARYICCAVDNRTMTPVDIPADIRAAGEAYMRAFPVADEEKP